MWAVYSALLEQPAHLSLTAKFRNGARLGKATQLRRINQVIETILINSADCLRGTERLRRLLRP